MPEDTAARQPRTAQQGEKARLSPAATSAPATRWLRVFIFGLVMVAEAVVIIYVMQKPRVSEEFTVGGATSAVTIAGPVHSTSELMAPMLDIPNIIVSVKVDDAGSRLHTLTTGVVLKIGKALEDKPEKEVDLEYLNKVYLPKVQQLVPAIKDAVIRQISSRSYSELLQPSVRQQILDRLRGDVNEMLRSYGIERRITEVYWTMWHFG